MAGIPLNTFLTRTKIVKQPVGFQYGYPNPSSTDDYMVYQAAPGTSGVILYAQCANVSNVNNYTVSAWIYRPGDTVNKWTEILINTPVPHNDALVMLGGKLVLETGDSIWVAGSAPTVGGTTDLKCVLSILESANQ